VRASVTAAAAATATQVMTAHALGGCRRDGPGKRRCDHQRQQGCRPRFSHRNPPFNWNQLIANQTRDGAQSSVFGLLSHEKFRSVPR
jgi:hypothetical protein